MSSLRQAVCVLGLLATACVAGEPEQTDIHAIRVADGEVRPLIATPDDEREPDWLPEAGVRAP